MVGTPAQLQADLPEDNQLRQRRIRIFEDREVPEVIEIQTFLGRVDVRLNVIARDMGHYQEVYRDRILTLPHIADIESLMLVSTIKETGSLPL